MNRQEMIDSIYTAWRNDNLSYSAKKAALTAKEKAALQLEKFDGQVNNGGFLQWEDNRYAKEDLADVCAYFQKAVEQGIENADKVLELLTQFTEIGNPADYYNEEEDDYYEYYSLTHALDTQYYELPDLTRMYDEMIERFTGIVLVKADIKPKCRLIGTDSNIFCLLSKVVETLRIAKQKDKIEQVKVAVTSSKSYDEALGAICQYVDVY